MLHFNVLHLLDPAFFKRWCLIISLCVPRYLLDPAFFFLNAGVLPYRYVSRVIYLFISLFMNAVNFFSKCIVSYIYYPILFILNKYHPSWVLQLACARLGDIALLCDLATINIFLGLVHRDVRT